MAWGNPFRHRSTQSAFLRQNDQNAPSQPRVDQRSNKAKIHTKKKKKKHFSWFYIKSKLLGDFWQIWPSLTWSWLSVGPRNPNFDLAVKTSWNQLHCKDYWIHFPTTIHGSKLELKQLRYRENYENCVC